MTIFIIQEDKRCFATRDERKAKAKRGGAVHRVETQAEFEGLPLSSVDLVRLHNSIRPKDMPEVRRFKDKATAHRRIWKLLEQLPEPKARKSAPGVLGVRAGTLKEQCAKLFVKAGEQRDRKKLIQQFIELGAKPSTAASWYQIFKRLTA